ncbi:MAG: hypothetical protein ACI4QT_04515 [Kiritimatiellia bacterium]
MRKSHISYPINSFCVFFFISFTLGAESFDSRAEAANEYVNVHSDTIGVHEIQTLNEGLDFWITTSNVVDRFEAEVVVQEMDESSWRLTKPLNGKRYSLAPGEKMKYVVEDTAGVESDKTGWIKLYRVDVMINGIGESNEEVDGAIIAYKTATNGYNDPSLVKYLVPVSLRCFTPDEDDVVSVEIKNSTLLVHNDSGKLEAAQSSYPASRLNELRFFLLGTQASLSECDQEITLIHNKTNCKDVARFSVWPNTSFVIQEVAFQNSAEIMSDCGIPFEIPQYKDSNHDRTISGIGERSVPVLYVRNTIPLIGAKFVHSCHQLSQPVYVRAESAAFRIPCTLASIDSDNVISITTATEKPIPDIIDFHDPLAIQWFVSTDNKSSWQSAGISTNRFYVTWAASRATKKLETLFFIGCKGAKGISGTTGIDDDRVVDAIWRNPFASLFVKTAFPQKVLSFYGFEDSNNNGQYDLGEIQHNTTSSCPFDENTDSFITLISKGYGQCATWAQLLLECWFAQGLNSVNGNAVNGCSAFFAGTAQTSFLIGVKNWEWSNQPAGVFPDGVHWFLATSSEANSGTLIPQNSSLSTAHCREILGISGQGYSPNPPAVFPVHFWVYDHRFYYDPSFGKRAQSPDELANMVFECFLIQEKSSEGDFYVIRKLPPIRTNLF